MEPVLAKRPFAQIASVIKRFATWGAKIPSEHIPPDEGLGRSHRLCRARALAVLHQADHLGCQFAVLLDLEIEHADSDEVRPVLEGVGECLTRINGSGG